MNDWKKYKLGEISDRITKGTTPSSIGSGFITSGINFIKAEAVTMDGQINKSVFAFIDSDTNDKLNRSKLAEGDILFSMAGIVLGKTAVVKKEHLPANTNQALALIRLKKEIACPEFIHYFFRQKQVFEYVNSITAQSAQPNINLAEIGDLDISLPPLNLQTQIASILSSLDSKIELNRRMNQTLEQIAATLFKKYFVDDIDPENLPEGWKYEKLGTHLSSISKTHKFQSEKIIFLNTGDISEGKILHNNYSFVDGLPGQAKKTICKKDILFSEIRPGNKRFAYVNFDAEDYVVSTKLMVLQSKTEIDSLFFYFILTQPEMLSYLQNIAESRSGTFPQITFDQIKEIDVLIPKKEFLNSFIDDHLKPVYQMIFNNWKESENLARTRDMLLPKLMSGEIDLSIPETELLHDEVLS